MTADFNLPRFDGEAACAEIGGDFWFPDPGDPDHNSRRAIAVCRRCEVIDQCGTWAIENGEPFGVWGGMTERQRRKFSGIRRRRAA